MDFITDSFCLSIFSQQHNFIHRCNYLVFFKAPRPLYPRQLLHLKFLYP